MKIVILCWRDTGHPQGGGSERYLEHVARHLVAAGHEVVFRTARYTDAPARSSRHGVRFSRAGGKLTVYPRAWLWLLAGRFGSGSAAGAQLIIDVQNGIPFYAKFFSGRPVVLLTHHCHRQQWPVAGPVLARLGWALERRSPRWHRGVPWVTVSSPSARQLRDLGVPAADITVVRNGLDPVPAQLPELRPVPGAVHLVTVSRLVPHKQIEHAIFLTARLRAQGLPVVLDVIGSGWWAEELVAAASAAGVSEHVIFHGQVSEQLKHAIIARAQVHLMPSVAEGWGLAVLEAAQHGVPTVGYRSAAGLQDSIVDGQTGILVGGESARPVQDQAELLQVVSQLLADSDYRQRLGAAAKKRAGEFSWADTGRAWEQLIYRLVNSRRTL